MFLIYCESNYFDIGTPSATAFPADSEEEDCIGEVIERSSVESKGGESELSTSNDEDDRVLQLMI